MRASARLLFAIAFIGGMDNAALAGSRASLASASPRVAGGLGFVRTKALKAFPETAGGTSSAT